MGEIGLRLSPLEKLSRFRHKKIMCLSGDVLVLQCGSFCCRYSMLDREKSGLWNVADSLGAWPEVGHDGDEGLLGKAIRP